MNDYVYNIRNVPLWNWSANKRVLAVVPIMLPSERIDREYARDPASFDPAKQDPSNILTPHVVNHPICKEQGPLNVVSLRVYWDKIPVYKSDSWPND